MKLTEAQLATLREMSSYPNAYWFRQATCKQLVALGLAEPVATAASTMRKRPPHRITEAGRQALKEAK